jgi:ribulose bisphosphate carboxylase small subunit
MSETRPPPTHIHTLQQLMKKMKQGLEISYELSQKKQFNTEMWKIWSRHQRKHLFEADPITLRNVNKQEDLSVGNALRSKYIVGGTYFSLNLFWEGHSA